MNYEMKTINKTILLSWSSIIGILLLTYIIQVIKQERSIQYLCVFLFIMVIPWMIVYVIYQKKKDWDRLCYIIVMGYSIMYLFVMLTGSTIMVSNYILPLLCFLILYHRPKLISYTFGIVIFINIISLLYDLSQNSITPAHVKEIEISFATIIICFAGSYISAKVYDVLHKERGRVTLAAMRAEAANEAKGEFLAHMSHEIRTPINAVLGMDTMILRESKDPTIREYAMDIQRAGKSLLAIINDILDFSKIESGKLEIIPIDYDFSSCVHDTVNMIQEKARTKGLTLNIIIDNDIPSVLHGDDVRIRQVLLNILNNAVKYTEKGEITFQISGTRVDNIEKLHFSVKDTGIGIKKEDLHKLFEQFERIEEERNRNIEGTGLGMAITLNLLNLMGTTLDVKSEYGVGSEFSFDIEQEIVNDEAVGNIAARMNQAASEYEYDVTFTAPDASVLVVDDNPTNLIVFKNLLKETKMNIDTASRGREALGLIREKKYDIIFLDHMMPDMDGIEVMQNINSDNTHRNVGTPVIALTANAIVGAKETYINAGFYNYLSKPINPDKLESLISKYLPEEKVNYEKVDAIPEKKKITYQESLPQIEGIDWEYARLHLINSDAILQTAKSVCDTIDMDTDELKEYYEILKENPSKTDALDSFRIKIHSIKSTATLLGILPIAGMAATLEYAARDGSVDKVIEITPHFLVDYPSYKQKLKGILQTDTEEKQKISDKSLIVDYIKLLMESASMFDVHGADDALEKIKMYQYDEELDSLIDSLTGALGNLDTDKVEELGNLLIDKLNRASV